MTAREGGLRSGSADATSVGNRLWVLNSLPSHGLITEAQYRAESQKRLNPIVQ